MDKDMPVRALTLLEVRKARGMGENEADIASVAWATGCLPAEVEAWMNSVPAGDALHLINRVMVASGLVEGAQFQG